MAEAKCYHLVFSGYLPEEIIKGVLNKNKIHFKKDTIHFHTRQEMMEMFDNPDKLVQHLKDTDVFKMMMDNNKKGFVFKPSIIVMPYFEATLGSKVWYNDIREIDLGFPRNAGPPLTILK